MRYTQSLMEESAMRDLIFLESVSRNVSYERRVGSGIFRKLAVGAHGEWLFEGLFGELLFDIGVTEGLSC